MFHKKHYSIVLLVLLILTFLPNSTAAGEGSLPILVGIYPTASLGTTVNEINDLDNYIRNNTGPHAISIAGTFVDIESQDWFIKSELDHAWNNGYVPFINLSAGFHTPRTAQEVADGVIDTDIRNWANIFRDWTQGGTKRAFIAPMQEMNGYWVTYKDDPYNYKRAFIRIRQIFDEQGVPSESVSWVFAPNGWNDPAKPENVFENFYPGNSVVDVIGFSSFNFGSCWSYTTSEPYEQLYKPYLDRMAAMAPGKPIFVAEIGSVAYGLDRAAWLSDTLTKIGAYPGVRAILYFNLTEATYNIDPNNPPNCNPVDYTLDAEGGEGKAVFKSIVSQYPYGYWAPDSSEMINIAFNRPDATFEDVWPASEFAGKNTTAYYQPWVERLVAAGITSGCLNTVVDFTGVTDYTFRYYCPENSVTRAQMAVFLEKGIHGAGYVPPNVSPSFVDSTGHWAEDWIESLKVDGITSGCATTLYCPENPTTRAQMSLFLLKSKYGPSHTPPAASGNIFLDVPISHWAAAWIENLAAEGITGGCGNNNYCPENEVTRGQMAIFLVKTFNLP